MEKKIRFGDLVRNSGRPQPMTLWTDPKNDKSFSKAVKENRIVTVIEDPASKRKGFGQIGFHAQPHAFYLVFPRSLPRENGSRVIGINYELLEEPRVGSDPVRNTKSEPKPPEIKIEPIQKKFKVRLRRTATVETNVDVTAKDRTEAEQLAIKRAQQQSFPLKQTEIKEEILREE
jgi:hypothetical protein